MSSHSLFKRALGATFIVSGTSIGAGMLAIPISSAGFGFIPSVILMVAMWAIMSLSALIMIDINLTFGQTKSIAYFSKKFLGPLGHIFASGSIIVLFYSLLAAYMSGGSSLLREPLTLTLSFLQVTKAAPSYLSSILFTLILCSVIFFSTHIVDKANRVLFFVKCATYITILFLLFKYINLDYLFTPITKPDILTLIQDNILLIVPVFFTSFGFHGSIPPLIKYVGPHPQLLRWSFIIGSAIPLFIYIGWEAVSLGTIPLTGPGSFSMILQNGGDLSLFINKLDDVSGSSILTNLIKLFSFLAIATSFLGVALGLFDYMHEILDQRKVQTPQIKAFIFTFTPPFIISLISPKIFIHALAFASIALSLIAVVLPILVAFQMNKRTEYPLIKNWQDKILYLFCLLIGTSVIVIEIINLLL